MCDLQELHLCGNKWWDVENLDTGTNESFSQRKMQHTTEFAPVSNVKYYGINPRWTHIVDLLVDSGHTPVEIRTQLVLKANNAKDQDEAISALPTIKQIRSRKRSRKANKSMTWRLENNADLLKIFQCSKITTREHFERAEPKTMIVWGVHTSKTANGKPFSFMNFSTKEMMRVIPKAMKCYGKILPLMGDGVHKLVVHDQWLLVFWGFPSRRFDADSRENRCVIHRCSDISIRTHAFVSCTHCDVDVCVDKGSIRSWLSLSSRRIAGTLPKSHSTYTICSSSWWWLTPLLH